MSDMAGVHENRADLRKRIEQSKKPLYGELDKLTTRFRELLGGQAAEVDTGG